MEKERFLIVFILFFGNYLNNNLADGLPNEPYLLYSNLNEISTLDISTNATSAILTGLDAVIALGYDSKSKKIFYGEGRKGHIYKSNLDGSDSQLILSQVGIVEGVCVDWATRTLYWTSYDNLRIEMSDLDGKYMKGLINTGLENARGIAVDPQEGYLFWSDWGIYTQIERSTLGGDSRTVIVNTGLTWPNGLTIDYANKRLYWIDAFHDTISSVKYDGSDRKLVFEDKTITVSRYHGFDLDFLNGELYWSDWNTNSIHRLQNSGSSHVVKDVKITTSRKDKGVMGIVAVDSARQPNVVNRCGTNNGGCAQLCVHKPGGFQCVCGNGFKLAADNKGCEDAFKEEFLMLADGQEGKIYIQPLDSIKSFRVQVPIPSDNITRPVALEYDQVDDMIYWTDVTKKIISRIRRDGTQYQLLFDDVGVADGLTIDMAGRNLYWTSTTTNKLETSKLDGSYRRTLVSSYLDEPRDIIVDPIAGYMYWTDWGIQPKIERAYMDGSMRETLVNESIAWPNGLTFDATYNRLYWADANHDTIEYLDLTTSYRDIVLNEKMIAGSRLITISDQLTHPFGLTHIDDYLFWTDWNTLSLHRSSITGEDITLVSSGFGKPMDIHAYSIKPRQDKRRTYTFEFPKYGQNFTCSKLTKCPIIKNPPACPLGYSSVRVGLKCNLDCRAISGYFYRCPCKDWMECGVRLHYKNACLPGQTSSFIIRECVQDVKPGRCLTNNTGSLVACNKDNDCGSDEKCCDGKCKSPGTINKHPCSTNNGGCDELCLAIPGGHRCACRNGYMYDNGQRKCVVDTRPTTPTPTVSPKICPAIPHPLNGESSCATGPVAYPGACHFKCDPGYKTKGWDILLCFSYASGYAWDDPPPTCERKNNPVFDVPCPVNISHSTDHGLPTKRVFWSPPKATDHDGSPIIPTANPPMTSPQILSVGTLKIVYTATAKDGLSSTCDVIIDVKDTEPPNFGTTCPSDITLNVKGSGRHMVTWKEPKVTDNTVKVTLTSIHKPGSLFSIGVSSIVYTAIDQYNNKAQCIFTITMIDVCDIVCTKIYKPVCASNGKTYSNECHFNRENCSTGGLIVLKKEACDCTFHKNDLFESTSKLRCSLDSQDLSCAVLCKESYELAIPRFGHVRCARKRMIRGNTLNNYVPMATLIGCEKQQFYNNVPSSCPANTQPMGAAYCVRCSAGSYYDSLKNMCLECDVGEYQDLPGQSSCKLCSQISDTRTSTTIGALDCFVNFGGSKVTLTVTKTNFDKEQFRNNLVDVFNEHCGKNTCSFTSKKRRKRGSNVVFKNSHVIVLSTSQKTTGTNVVLLVLDPTSTSLLPDETLSSSSLEKLIRAVLGQLSGIQAINSVNVIENNKDNNPEKNKGDDDDNRSKTGYIVGPVMAFVAIAVVAIVIIAYMFYRRRKRRNPNVQTQGQPSGSVQFHSDVTNGQTVTMSGQQNQAVTGDGNRHGFLNQTYLNVHPPSYATTDDGVPHTYETVDDVGAKALPVKKAIPDSAFVDVGPPLYNEPGEVMGKNIYSTPREPTADDELKIDPPPQYDNAKLRVMREKAASSILPNVPRAKKPAVDTNENEEGQASASGSRNDVHTVHSATSDHSQS